MTGSLSTDPVFLQELRRDGPRGVTDHLVYVAAVYESFVALAFGHYCVAFVLVCQLVTAN